jgi:microcin C transport system substrate-binding protein
VVPCPNIALWINESRPPLDNRDIRLGIQYAANFDLICRDYFRGDAVREETVSDGYGWRTNPTIGARPFDPVKARGYFAQAGFAKQGPDGVLVNGQGQRLSFTITTAYRNYQDLLTILKQEALKAGLEFNIEVLDATTAWKKMSEKQHEIALCAFAPFVEMYPRYWENYASENAYDVPFLADGSPNPARKAKPDTSNLTSIAIPELDRLIHTYDHANSMAQVKALASRIEQIIYDDAGWVNGWKEPFYRLGYWRWVKWPEQFNGMQSMDYEQFWLFSIDQDAQKETLAAKEAGKTFPRQILTLDQFKDK